MRLPIGFAQYLRSSLIICRCPESALLSWPAIRLRYFYHTVPSAKLWFGSAPRRNSLVQKLKDIWRTSNFITSSTSARDRISALGPTLANGLASVSRSYFLFLVTIGSICVPQPFNFTNKKRPVSFSTNELKTLFIHQAKYIMLSVTIPVINGSVLEKFSRWVFKHIGFTPFVLGTS
jgi:hypothetical protein